MDKYKRIRTVSRGVHGTVFLCSIEDRDGGDDRSPEKPSSDSSDSSPKTTKQVILKEISLNSIQANERKPALIEANVLSRLNHPFIVRYNESLQSPTSLVLVMEYLEGGNMAEFLASRDEKLLPECDVLRFFSQLVLGLSHIHGQNILHRDLKTQNIFMDKFHRTAKIGDFGISKVLESQSKAQSVVGTPSYISPELCEGKPYNHKSDIWSLGCVLYEMLTLHRAFEAPTLTALVLKILRGRVAPVPQSYSEALRNLLLDLLHLEPDRRPSVNSLLASAPLLVTLDKIRLQMPGYT
ncbi:unnamed protein product [Cyprideis torosa]|uniref:non-specific serine/threonine protein kinase n=1 Tax=Cyprideis torosa TaxID=163714 RepID=A0A7R8WH13_9CRUS|nr:unnamed protein product [Cyprideis torosa]CAG0897254.1 unnamed protein product [Cyprideis torosa]